MKIKWPVVVVTTAFLASIPFAVPATEQQRQRQMTESEKQRLEQLVQQKTETKSKKPAPPAPAPKPRPDDSTLKPGETVPQETPVEQPRKPKRDPYIR